MPRLTLGPNQVHLLLKRHNINHHDLDDKVYEAKASEASSINNQGFYEQFRYLVEEYGMPIEEIDLVFQKE